MDDVSLEKCWNEIYVRGKLEKPREKPTLTSIHPTRNSLGVTETRTQDPSGGRRALAAIGGSLGDVSENPVT